MAKKNAKSDRKEKGRTGPKGSMSRAIVDWGYPLILEYGKMKHEGKDAEAKDHKAAAMKDFKETNLADPQDKVHLDAFDVELSKSSHIENVSTWWRNTYSQSWDGNGDFAQYRMRTEATARTDGVIAESPAKAKTALELFFAANKSQVQDREAELLDEALNDVDEEHDKAATRLDCHTRAKRQLYEALDDDAKAAFQAEAEAEKMAAAAARKMPQAIEANREQLLSDVKRLVGRVRSGKFGIAVVGVELAFHDEDDNSVRSFSFSNARYDLTGAGTPMWSNTEAHKDSFKSFKEHSTEYIAGCVTREMKAKRRAQDGLCVDEAQHERSAGGEADVQEDIPRPPKTPLTNTDACDMSPRSMSASRSTSAPAGQSKTQETAPPARRLRKKTSGEIACEMDVEEDHPVGEELAEDDMAFEKTDVPDPSRDVGSRDEAPPESPRSPSLESQPESTVSPSLMPPATTPPRPALRKAASRPAPKKAKPKKTNPVKVAITPVPVTSAPGEAQNGVEGITTRSKRKAETDGRSERPEKKSRPRKQYDLGQERRQSSRPAAIAARQQRGTQGTDAPQTATGGSG